MWKILERPKVRTVLVIVGVGALLGLAAALRPPAGGPVVEDLQPPEGTRPAFASYFVHFFLGRTPDGSPPRPNSPLLRAMKFLAGERVGLRVQTPLERRSTFVVEMRFLSRETKEELPALRDDRQSFRIRRGLRTYCCLRIPKETGDYDLGLLVENQFVAFLPINVKEPPHQGGGGLFVAPEE
ncbi:MAG: hypothetical protein G01um101438_122 [Parcubacteria group bacterium Gr01-1014_38]|nr:MAG: hypothetical protein G01um101438_122 [Parcubacteria group bacterium Gr01-1014_38]